MGALTRIYLSRPMAGYEENNHPAFEKECQRLRKAGFDVVSPHELEAADESWDSWLRADLREMLTCEAVVTLPGWQASRGARLETSVAIMVGMPVMSVDDVYVYRA